MLKHGEGAVVCLSRKEYDGLVTTRCGFPVNSLLGAIVALWRFWRRHGTGRDSYDRFELRIVREERP